MSLINFYHPFILVNNLRLRSETSIDKDRVHTSDKWKRWFGMFGIIFFIKNDMNLVYYITWIHHRKVYDISLTIKRKLDKKLPLRSALGLTRFTHASIQMLSGFFCFNTEWNIVKLSVINLWDMINKIHVSFDEKKYSEHAKPTFSLIRRVDMISVYRCLWSKSQIIDKYERIIKVD
jgi:hypothetical protein